MVIPRGSAKSDRDRFRAVRMPRFVQLRANPRSGGVKGWGRSACLVHSCVLSFAPGAATSATKQPDKSAVLIDRRPANSGQSAHALGFRRSVGARATWSLAGLGSGRATGRGNAQGVAVWLTTSDIGRARDQGTARFARRGHPIRPTACRTFTGVRADAAHALTSTRPITPTAARAAASAGC
jgi:hypothetical protein